MKKEFKFNTFFLVKAAVIAAIYVVLTLILQWISFGPIQFRLSEALVMLPYIDPAAIPGVAIGCLLANLTSPFGLLDIIGGSTITLIAAFFTYKIKNKYLAVLPPVILNAFGVSLYLAPAEGLPYWLVVGQIALSELVVVGIIGIPIVTLYEKVIAKNINFN